MYYLAREKDANKSCRRPPHETYRITPLLLQDINYISFQFRYSNEFLREISRVFTTIVQLLQVIYSPSKKKLYLYMNIQIHIKSIPIQQPKKNVYKFFNIQDFFLTNMSTECKFELRRKKCF